MSHAASPIRLDAFDDVDPGHLISPAIRLKRTAGKTAYWHGSYRKERESPEAALFVQRDQRPCRRRLTLALDLNWSPQAAGSPGAMTRTSPEIDAR